MMTVVSCCPFEIKEWKPSVQPETFLIPAAPDNGVSVLHVDKTKRVDYRLNPSGEGITELVPIEDEEMCRSIINDYCIAQLIGSTPESGPGLFFVEGKHTAEEVEILFAAEIKIARQRHQNWCIALVRLADDDWQNYHQYKFIGDPQIMAAHYLNIQREWLVKPQEIAQVKCPACMSYVNSRAVICLNCKYILKPEEHSKLQFAEI